MLTKGELICINAFYIFWAVTIAVISTFFNEPSKRQAMKRKEPASGLTRSNFVEIVFIIWNCLYIATLLCVLWHLLFQMEYANIKYLCSWFVILQIMFYLFFLISYVVCMDRISIIIRDILFPIINALAWIVSTVCLLEGHGWAEFQDIRYFTVHILPTVAACFHEIYINSFYEVLPSATKTRQLKEVWMIYCPALFLTCYALNQDQVEVYKHQLRPPNPWFVAVIGVFSNVRLVCFPLACVRKDKSIT